MGRAWEYRWGIDIGYGFNCIFTDMIYLTSTELSNIKKVGGNLHKATTFHSARLGQH